VSAGYTALLETDTADSFVARADALMYRSKEAGRNRDLALLHDAHRVDWVRLTPCPP